MDVGMQAKLFAKPDPYCKRCFPTFFSAKGKNLQSENCGSMQKSEGHGGPRHGIAPNQK